MIDRWLAYWKLGEPSSYSFEIYKLSLMRWLTGLVAIERVGHMLYTAPYLFDSNTPTLLLSLLTLLLLMYTVGFALPVVTVALLLTYVPLELHLETYTLWNLRTFWTFFNHIGDSRPAKPLCGLLDGRQVVE